MVEMEFKLDETVILNDKIARYLPMRVGSLAKVIEILHTSPNYDYDVWFSDGEISPVRECELIKLTEEDEKYISYLFQGNKVRLNFDEVVTIQKCDYLNRKAEIEFGDHSNLVVDFKELYPLEMPTIEPIHFDSLEEKQIDIYKDLINIFFKHYKNQDDTYTIPKELLVNMLKGLYAD